MLHLLCAKCQSCVRIVGDDQEVAVCVGEKSEYYPSSYSCPFCGGQMSVTSGWAARAAVATRTFEVHEFFQYLNGLGLPEERVVTADTIGALFKEHRVTEMRAVQIGNGGVHVESLLFDNGDRIYFCASPMLGAVIYRHVKSGTVTTRVLKEELDGPPRNSAEIPEAAD